MFGGAGRLDSRCMRSGALMVSPLEPVAETDDFASPAPKSSKRMTTTSLPPRYSALATAIHLSGAASEEDHSHLRPDFRCHFLAYDGRHGPLHGPHRLRLRLCPRLHNDHPLPTACVLWRSFLPRQRGKRSDHLRQSLSRRPRNLGDLLPLLCCDLGNHL